MLKSRMFGRKIFCIGPNKTGTSSLHQLFTSGGLNSCHSTRWASYTHLSFGKAFFLGHQAFCDGVTPNFVRLDEWFPNALFIFNDRPEESWIAARIRHCLVAHPDGFEVAKKALFDKRQFGVMANGFFVNPEAAIDAWIAELRLYRQRALAYFSERSHFLVLSVTEDHSWASRTSDFLMRYGIECPSKSRDFWENSRSDKYYDQNKLNMLMDYYRLRWKSD